MYLDRPDQWDRLAAVLAAEAEIGVDSETFGQPDKVSPAWRASVQCWSVAVRSTARHPRGYRVAVGRVLPAAALDHPGLRAVLESPGILKLAHNAPHDDHSLRNRGLAVANLRDTLQWARVALPGLGGYGLKDLEVAVLGKPERPKFLDVVALPHTERVVRRVRERGCTCGVDGCRKRSGHRRVEWLRFRPEDKPAIRRRDVSEMTPGCPGWDAWVGYAMIDAVSVLELAEVLALKRPLWGPEVYPWG